MDRPVHVEITSLLKLNSSFPHMDVRKQTLKMKFYRVNYLLSITYIFCI